MAFVKETFHKGEKGTMIKYPTISFTVKQRNVFCSKTSFIVFIQYQLYLWLMRDFPEFFWKGKGNKNFKNLTRHMNIYRDNHDSG